MTDVVPNPSADLNTQENHQEVNHLLHISLTFFSNRSHPTMKKNPPKTSQTSRYPSNPSNFLIFLRFLKRITKIIPQRKPNLNNLLSRSFLLKRKKSLLNLSLKPSLSFRKPTTEVNTSPYVALKTPKKSLLNFMAFMLKSIKSLENTKCKEILPLLIFLYRPQISLFTPQQPPNQVIQAWRTC